MFLGYPNIKQYIKTA